ncbi:hypothetical protein [Rhizobium rhizogenes]|uniref:hypothetical protein n=1 Tax=Rhizobium rhizogenes TaxID=359 RepID=UPI00193D2B09|nr:hypothetical protein [Rhizobium rhizogenes]
MPSKENVVLVDASTNTWRDTQTDQFYVGREGQTIDSILEEDAASVEYWASQVNKLMVPENISDRQFFQQLAISGLITDAEALAAVKTGDIPATMESFIEGLPTDQRFAARMVLCGATQFSRNHPLVAQFGAANAMTSYQIDDLWVDAAKL